MTYQTSVTKKGQMTIPKAIRDYFGVKAPGKVTITWLGKTRSIRIKPEAGILAVADTIKIKKRVNPLDARKALEKRYRRS